MWFSPAIVMRENIELPTNNPEETVVVYVGEDEKAPQTTIPFVKNNNFEYSDLTQWMGKYAATGGWFCLCLLSYLL